MSFEIPISKLQKDKLVDQLSRSPALFDELMKLYTSDQIDDRFGWPLTYVIENKPSSVKGWEKLLLAKLKVADSDMTRRVIIRSFQFIEIPKDLIPEILEVCYEVLLSGDHKIAARVFAMTVIFNQCKIYPELSQELELTLLELNPIGSTGFQNRASKIIKRLQKKRHNP